MKPSIATNVLMSLVADGSVAYDPTTDQLHRLNPVATLIVEFCDGQRSVAEIAKSLIPFLPGEADDVVGQWVDQAMQAGILVDATSSSAESAAAHESLTAADLTDLADRLRERGKVQTAFICQQHAAELTPDDSETWRALGELAHIVGHRTAARDAYERYLAIVPEDAEVAHLLTALSDENGPQRVPDNCIEQLYRRFSTFYDENLYDELESEIPGRLAELTRTTLGDPSGLAVADLGCGTGVSGEHFRGFATTLIGVDLSPEMVEVARKKNVYNRLDVAEITQWLGQCDERFDLIIASDSFIYFGDLAQVIVPAADLLNPGAAIAFSVESAGMFITPITSRVYQRTPA